MDELSKLRINIQCLIRLAKTELYDSFDDLKRNIEMIKYYEQKDSIKYEPYVEQLKKLNNIYIDSIIQINIKLKNYYNDLKDFSIERSINSEIDEYQFKLEQSINNLEANKLHIKKAKETIKDKSIIIVSSETEYLTSEVLSYYDELEQAKLKHYKEKYPYILTKKYN